MSDKATDTLRRTMQAIVEVAPEAPDISTLVIPASVGHRRPAFALVGGFVLVLLVGIVTAIFVGFRADGDSADSTIAGPVEGWVTVLYLDNAATDAQRQLLIEGLSSDFDVLATKYVDKEAALAEAVELYAEQPDVLQVLESNPGLVPASLRILSRSKAVADRIAAAASDGEGVVVTEVYYGTVDRLVRPVGQEESTSGIVAPETLDELQSALLEMVACMETRGIAVFDWAIDPDGAWSIDYAAEDEQLAQPVFDSCYESHLRSLE